VSEFTVDLTARPAGDTTWPLRQSEAGDIGDRLLDALGRPVVVAVASPAVSQDTEAGTLGATFTVEAPDIEVAFALGRAHFGAALYACGLGGWTYTEMQVGPAPALDEPAG
jgi:hypothetical protein